mmetsp:Transcript_32260/g.49381  ORF Transcript_32260/g.49381 Transcript_32260/m.49381 type:complete len:82 (+) Transcript_32260:4028-4273(+)
MSSGSDKTEEHRAVNDISTPTEGSRINLDSIASSVTCSPRFKGNRQRQAIGQSETDIHVELSPRLSQYFKMMEDALGPLNQ